MNEKDSSKILVRITVILIIVGLILYAGIASFPLLSNPGDIQKTATVEAATEAPAEATGIPASETPPPTSTITVSSSGDAFESTGTEENPDIDQESLRVGELEIEYPPRMMVQESETVALSVFIPRKIASVSLLEFERIPISANQPGTIDNLSNFSTFTVLYDSMRADMKSTSFTIEPLQSDEPRPVDLNAPEVKTTWQWIIQAPDFPGEQVIVVSVYLGDETQPSWVGSIKIDVTSPAPEPTTTPAPVLVRIRDQIVDSISIEVCLGIPALILAIFTVIDQVKKRMKKKKRKTTK